MTPPDAHAAPPLLREGFTTGSAATAAAVAALLLLLDGTQAEAVDIPLPPDLQTAAAVPLFPAVQTALCVPVHTVQHTADGATATVIKDGGDDPDATHGAHICVDLVAELHPMSPPLSQPAVPPLSVSIDGGTGVGRVTLPGLPVPIGYAAINPAPQAQIRLALHTICAARGLGGYIGLIIRVPEGARRATHTLNPRLGIVGGISILGTRGTVRPYSHDAWQQTIRQAIDVAAATGCDWLGLSSGRRSERLLQTCHPDWPPHAFVQAADFIGFAVREAAARGFLGLTWGCFCGKLAKVAAGHTHTHARVVELDLTELATLAKQAGFAPDQVAAIRTANTAAQAFDIIVPAPPPAPMPPIPTHSAASHLVDALLAQALATLTREAQVAANAAGVRLPALSIRLFHLDGRELARTGAVL